MPDYEELSKLVDSYKQVGLKVILTSGSFDLIHIGHLDYLEKAKATGDILIVGVESDDKIRSRKKRRVAVPETERMKVLTHQRHVDIVTLKPAGEERWRLIKTVRPDVLVIVAEPHLQEGDELVPESYTADEMQSLREWCGEIVMLPRQSTVSSTARIRELLIEGVVRAKEKVDQVFNELLGSGE